MPEHLLEAPVLLLLRALGVVYELVRGRGVGRDVVVGNLLALIMTAGKMILQLILTSAGAAIVGIVLVVLEMPEVIILILIHILGKLIYY